MKFQNLFEVLDKEYTEDVQSAINNRDSWVRYLTSNEIDKIENGKKTIEDYRNKIAKKVMNLFQRRFRELSTVENTTRKIKSLGIVVEFKANRTWGRNPKAELRVTFDDGSIENFVSESIGGCGYDKESAATGQALNQCAELRAEMFAIKENNINVANGECIGYGAGYGVLPYFEGGVGFNCHRLILEKLGYKLTNETYTKTVNVYYFVKEEKE